MPISDLIRRADRAGAKASLAPLSDFAKMREQRPWLSDMADEDLARMFPPAAPPPPPAPKPGDFRAKRPWLADLSDEELAAIHPPPPPPEPSALSTAAKAIPHTFPFPQMQQMAEATKQGLGQLDAAENWMEETGNKLIGQILDLPDAPVDGVGQAVGRAAPGQPLPGTEFKSGAYKDVSLAGIMTMRSLYRAVTGRNLEVTDENMERMVQGGHIEPWVTEVAGELVGGLTFFGGIGAVLRTYKLARWVGKALYGRNPKLARFMAPGAAHGATFGTGATLHEALDQVRRGELSLEDLGAAAAGGTVMGVGLGWMSGFTSPLNRIAGSATFGMGTALAQGGSLMDGTVSGSMFAILSAVRAKGINQYQKKGAIDGARAAVQRGAREAAIAYFKPKGPPPAGKEPPAADWANVEKFEALARAKFEKDLGHYLSIPKEVAQTIGPPRHDEMIRTMDAIIKNNRGAYDRLLRVMGAPIVTPSTPISAPTGVTVNWDFRRQGWAWSGPGGSGFEKAADHGQKLAGGGISLKGAREASEAAARAKAMATPAPPLSAPPGPSSGASRPSGAPKPTPQTPPATPRVAPATPNVAPQPAPSPLAVPPIKTVTTLSRNKVGKDAVDTLMAEVPHFGSTVFNQDFPVNPGQLRQAIDAALTANREALAEELNPQDAELAAASAFTEVVGGSLTDAQMMVEDAIRTDIFAKKHNFNWVIEGPESDPRVTRTKVDPANMPTDRSGVPKMAPDTLLATVDLGGDSKAEVYHRDVLRWAKSNQADDMDRLEASAEDIVVQFVMRRGGIRAPRSGGKVVEGEEFSGVPPYLRGPSSPDTAAEEWNRQMRGNNRGIDTGDDLVNYLKSLEPRPEVGAVGTYYLRAFDELLNDILHRGNMPPALEMDDAPQQRLLQEERAPYQLGGKPIREIPGQEGFDPKIIFSKESALYNQFVKTGKALGLEDDDAKDLARLRVVRRRKLSPQDVKAYHEFLKTAPEGQTISMQMTEAVRARNWLERGRFRPGHLAQAQEPRAAYGDQTQTFDPNNPNILKDVIGPRWYSPVEEVLKRKLPEKATPEQVTGLLMNSPGVKIEEIDWLGLPDFLEGKTTVQKADLMAWIDENKVGIKSVMLGPRTRDIESSMLRRERKVISHPDDKVLPGGELVEGKAVVRKLGPLDPGFYAPHPDPHLDHLTRYRNIRLFPDLEGYREFILEWRHPKATLEKSPHWHEKDVLLHTRTVDAKTKTGRNALVVIEVQSDKHQEAQRIGYRSPKRDAAIREEAGLLADRIMGGRDFFPGNIMAISRNEVAGYLEEAAGAAFTLDDFKADAPNEDYAQDAYEGSQARAVESVRAFADAAGERGDSALKADLLAFIEKTAPWAGTPPERRVPEMPFKKTWPELALKRMIRFAAEMGYDGIALPRGDDQVKLNQMTGLQADGMRKFYDEILPRIAAKYIKRWGGTIRDDSIETNPQNFLPPYFAPVYYFDITPEMRSVVLSKGQAMFERPATFGPQEPWDVRFVPPGAVQLELDLNPNPATMPAEKDVAPLKTAPPSSDPGVLVTLPNRKQIQSDLAKSYREIGRMVVPDQIIKSPADAAWLFRAISNPHRETVQVAGIKDGKVVGVELLGIGTIDQVAVYPRNILSFMRATGADGFVVAHNHPSGDPTPSPEDKSLTDTLARFANAIGVEFHGHVVINDDTFSFLDKHGGISTYKHLEYEKTREVPHWIKYFGGGKWDRPQKGPQLNQPAKVFELAKNLGMTDRTAMIMFLDNHNHLRKAVSVPSGAMPDARTIADYADSIGGAAVIAINLQLPPYEARALKDALNVVDIKLVDNLALKTIPSDTTGLLVYHSDAERGILDQRGDYNYIDTLYELPAAGAGGTAAREIGSPYGPTGGGDGYLDEAARARRRLDANYKRAAMTPEKKATLDDWKDKRRGMVREFADRIGVVMTSRLWRIKPHLKDGIRWMEFSARQASKKDINEVRPYLAACKTIKSASKKDWQVTDLAMANGDAETYLKMAAKYKIPLDTFRNYRKWADEITRRIHRSGFTMGYRINHFPRGIHNAKGLLTEFGLTGQGGVFSDDPAKAKLQEELRFAIADQEDHLGRLMGDKEKAAFVDRFIRGPDRTPDLLRRTGNMRHREIPELTPELFRHYYSTPDALLRYITAVNDHIAARNFFALHGRAKPQLSAEEKKALSEMSDDEAFESMRSFNNINDAVDGFTARLLEDGQITIAQEEELTNLLKKRFAYESTHGWVGWARDIVYLDTLTNFIPALTQFEDVGYALLKAPKQTPGALVRAMVPVSLRKIMRGSDISLEDLGLDELSHEMSEIRDSGTARRMILRKLFGASLFTYMDRVGKETTINAYVQRLRDLLKEGGDAGVKAEAELYSILGPETDQAIIDLKAGRTTENIWFYAMNALSDQQPVTLSELPEAYHENKNHRLFYTLKTFMVRRFNFIRDEVTKAAQNQHRERGGAGAKAAWAATAAALRQLLRLWMVLGVWGAAPDEMKDFILFRPTKFRDRVIDNMIKPFGVHKFHIYGFRRAYDTMGPAAAVGATVMRFAMPPMRVLESAVKDITKAGEPVETAPGQFEPRKLEIMASLPIGGNLWSWWFGRRRQWIQEKQVRDFKRAQRGWSESEITRGRRAKKQQGRAAPRVRV